MAAYVIPKQKLNIEEVIVVALVAAATFAVLGVLPLIVLAELGFAVGFGVLLDTILVRSIIVPALVHDIGPAIWWPSKLRHDPAMIKG